MKTCLNCGSTNLDSASTCTICGKDLHTGEQAASNAFDPSSAGQANHSLAVWALPRPENPFASLMLAIPALVLFLLGFMIFLEPSVEWFYDLKLPSVPNVGLYGSILMLAALAFVGAMLVRMIKLFAVRNGYYMILREGGENDHILVNHFKRYRARATKLYFLFWLLPIALIVTLMVFFYMGSFAYGFMIGGVMIPIPDVEDPIPYVSLLAIGLVALLVQFVISARATVAYKRYAKALRGEQVRGLKEVRSGLTAALDARHYPQPEVPTVYLLLIPGVVTLLLIGLAILLAPSMGEFMGVHLPEFLHPLGSGLVVLLASIVLGVTMIVCYRKQKAVNDGYYEALKMDESTPFSMKLEKYAHYQKRVCDPYCFLWLIPAAMFVGIMQFLYVASYAKHALILGKYQFTFPDVEEPLPYVLMSLLSAVFVLILFFSTWSKTRAFRHSDVLNRKRRHEEAIKAAELAEAQAEAAAAEQADASEEEGLWGDYSVAVAEDTAAPAGATATGEEEASPLDDFGFFLNADDDAYATNKPAGADADREDTLSPLCGIDAAGVPASVSTRKASNLHQLCDWFMEFAKSNGYEPELSSARALLAAMSTSRVVFVRACDEASEAFAATLAQFFGSNAPVADVTDAWGSSKSLLFTGSYNSKKASDCLCGMYRATYENDSFCTLTLTNAEKASPKNYLADILRYAESPKRTHAIQLLDEPAENLPAHATLTEGADGGVYMNLPANVWCLVMASDGKQFCAPEEGFVTGAALTVSLRGKACEPVVAEDADTAGLSAEGFRRLTRGITEHNFLPEEQWKKFDRIEKFLQDRAGLRFDNRLMRRLEKFSSTYLAVDNNANQILDAMLEAVFLPWVAQLDPSVLGPVEDGAGICETMALAFGADNIPYCMQALHELGFEA